MNIKLAYLKGYDRLVDFIIIISENCFPFNGALQDTPGQLLCDNGTYHIVDGDFQYCEICDDSTI